MAVGCELVFSYRGGGQPKSALNHGSHGHKLQVLWPWFWDAYFITLEETKDTAQSDIMPRVAIAQCSGVCATTFVSSNLLSPPRNERCAPEQRRFMLEKAWIPQGNARTLTFSSPEVHDVLTILTFRRMMIYLFSLASDPALILLWSLWIFWVHSPFLWFFLRFWLFYHYLFYGIYILLYSSSNYVVYFGTTLMKSKLDFCTVR